MADRRDDPRFEVETVELDLPSLAGAFGQRLRAAGIPVTPERAGDFARALELVRPQGRRRLYWTARAIFLAEESQAAAFDRAFDAVFGARLPAERRADAAADADADAAVDPAAPDRRPVADRAGTPRAATAPSAPLASPQPGAERERPEGIELPRAIASEEERLATKRFDALGADELAALQRLMGRLEVATPERRSRRFERANHGRGVDLRRTLRGSLRNGGDPARLARRRRRVVRRRLVLLCDISGSMEPYARAYLQFLTSAAAAHAEAFVFATRLTRLTRALAGRSPQQAIDRAAAAAPDWSSGTRIAAALKRFNDEHGRRGMARGAVVVILSDGWERGDPELVGREMERLGRLAHRIVWVNPRLGARDFSVAAGGMVAALAHCDALVSGRSFAALGEVVEAIAAPPGSGSGAARAARVRAELAARPTRDADEDEAPWGSATPVPGSSVAMPSGWGPSRGRTTPGW